MKNLHYGYCLVGVAFAVVLLVGVGVKASTLGVLGIALICPLMMVVMMKTMMRDRTSSPKSDQPVEHGRNR